MKRLLCAILSICLVLTGCLAVAEEGFLPGQTALEQTLGALMNGQVVSLSVSCAPELDTEMLIADEDVRAIADVLLPVLQYAQCTGGIAIVDDGVRLELEAQISSSDYENSVNASIAVTACEDGLYVETNLLDGKKLFVTWQNLFDMLGIDASVLELATSVTPEEFAEMVEAALAQAQQLAEQAAEVIMPYIGIVMDWVNTLDIQTVDHPEQEGYPETAMEMDIFIFPSDFGALISNIADQLEQDDAAKALISSLAEMAGKSIDFEEVVAMMRAINEELSAYDELFAICIAVGMDEAGNPIYFELYVFNPQDNTVYACATAMFYVDDEGVTVFFFDVYVLDGEDYIDMQYILNVATDENGVVNAAGAVYVVMNDILMIDVEVEGHALQTPTAYEFAMSEVLTYDESVAGMPISANFDTHEYAEKADDGTETDESICVISITVGDETVEMSFANQNAFVLPLEGSSLTTFVCDALGVKNFQIATRLSAHDYVPANLAVVEITSVDDLAALEDELGESAMALIFGAMSVLPQEAVALLMGE